VAEKNRRISHRRVKLQASVLHTHRKLTEEPTMCICGRSENTPYGKRSTAKEAWRRLLIVWWSFVIYVTTHKQTPNRRPRPCQARDVMAIGIVSTLKPNPI